MTSKGNYSEADARVVLQQARQPAAAAGARVGAEKQDPHRVHRSCLASVTCTRWGSCTAT
jgi:hypothetical protein